MKKLLLFVAISILVSSAVYAEETSVTVESVTPIVSAGQAAEDQQSVMADESQTTPTDISAAQQQLKYQLSDLESQQRACWQRWDSEYKQMAESLRRGNRPAAVRYRKKITATKSRYYGLQSRIDAIESQLKLLSKSVANHIATDDARDHNMANQIAILWQKVSPQKGEGGNSEMSAGMIAGIVFLGLLAIAGLTLGIVALATRGGGRFLADPNHEAAKSSPAPQYVGEREIVSSTARGDYHRETVASEDAVLASELSRARRTEAITAMFGNRPVVVAPAAAPAPAPVVRFPDTISVRMVGGEPAKTEGKAEKKTA